MDERKIIPQQEFYANISAKFDRLIKQQEEMKVYQRLILVSKGTISEEEVDKIIKKKLEEVKQTCQKIVDRPKTGGKVAQAK